VSRAARDQPQRVGPSSRLNISDAVIPAKLLRLVCDTAAVRARVQQRRAAGSGARRRFRAGNGRQKLAGRACGRKRRRRCALPAQSKTRTELSGALGLRGAPRSAAVSRAARDQPQRVGTSSRVEYLRRGHSCGAAAAGLRHSRGPGAGPVTAGGGKRSATPLSCGRRSSEARGPRGRAKAPSPLALCRRSPRRGRTCRARWDCAGRHGARLCPARRGISRSASGPQAGLSISDAVIPAKLLRLVCDTAAVRVRIQ
jgi:hypothetical protein